MRYLILISLFLSGGIYASTYKCIDLSGNISFQENPCIKGKEEILKSNNGTKENYEHSMWVGPNYVDTQYSVLFKSIGVYEYKDDEDIQSHIPLGWKSYKVRGEVKEVFKGNFSTNEILDVLVYLDPPYYQVETLRGNYILSFCKSKSGIYYLGTQYQLQKATEGNIRKFRDVQINGTSHEGDEDCIYNNPSFNPDTHN